MLTFSVIYCGFEPRSDKTKNKFEDTKGVIRSRKSKDKQHKDQMKKYKRTNNDVQNIKLQYW
jgi:hypothetical protein